MQQLEALVKMTPTKEEEEKFSLYDGDIDELDPAEKFVKVVLSIPFAFSRVQVMLYRETFEDEVAHLRKSFAMLEVRILKICLVKTNLLHLSAKHMFLFFFLSGSLQRT